jgi:uncharacterized protein (DUF302 family)
MSGPDDGSGGGAVTKASARSVADTVDRLVQLCRTRSLKVFAVIDQAAEARQVGLDLRETVLVLFGNPAAGTPVMAASPLSALDLPLKVLIWADPERGTRVSYTDPAVLATRYGLGPELGAALAGVNGLTDALVADA